MTVVAVTPGNRACSSSAHATCEPAGAAGIGGGASPPARLPRPAPGRRWAPGVQRHANYTADAEWDRAVYYAARWAMRVSGGVVMLRVIETEPGIKNATATTSFKPAKLETGISVQVPPFVNNGESIRVNTDDGSYVERATEK